MVSKFKLMMGLASLMAYQSFGQDFGKKLTEYTASLAATIKEVDEERASTLQEIGDFIVNELQEDGSANLLVICTHNSRRSHIGQAWLHVAGMFYGVDGIRAFSGGTEATAFNKNAVAALNRAGFVTKEGRGDNPRYELIAGSKKWIHYSKKYTDSQNPSSDFGAIMVCSEADKSCPLVKGADARFSLPYNDPRYSDGTPSQDVSYDETVRLIGKEMFYLMNYVKEEQVKKLEAKKG